MSVDRLDVLLERFSMRVRLFHVGLLCGAHDYDEEKGIGHLHLLKSGSVSILHMVGKPVLVEVPSLIFYPTSIHHRFVGSKAGAELVCASVQFEGGANNPLVQSLPPFFVVPLSAMEPLRPIMDALFGEAFGKNCGRQAAVDRLAEVALIHVLRLAMVEGHTSTGMLAGMAHPGLARAIAAMHDEPAHPWTLDDLAGKAGMSRSRFANLFHEKVGITPGKYLAGWRITLAQEFLRKGKPLKVIADEVGYASAPALSRAFRTVTRQSPREWRSETT